MKKFFEKVKNLVLKHKLLSIIVMLAFILFLVLLFVTVSMTISGGNKYGNRLDGIKDVEISKSTLKELENKIKESEEVKSVSVRVKGKIVYFDITYNRGTSQDRAKEIASSTLELLKDDEKAFYDMEYILIEDQGDDKETPTFIIAGTKHASLESIAWTRS